jgi:PAS domain-containing protein
MMDGLERKSSDNTGEKKQWFRAIFDSSSDGIFISNSRGRFIEVNKAGCAMFGYNRCEILERDIGELSADVTPHTESGVPAARKGATCAAAI